MAQLTETQKTFLDRYVREHRVLGKKKSSDAAKYVEAKGALETLLATWPSFSSVRTEFEKQLTQADAQADQGEFRTARRQVRRLTSDAKKAQSKYNPEPDIQSTARMIASLTESARGALPQMNALQEWRAAKGEEPAPPIDKARGFLATANARVESISARIDELQRTCQDPQLRAAVVNLRKDLWARVTSSEFEPLKRQSDTFFTALELDALARVQSSGVEGTFEELHRDAILTPTGEKRSRPVRKPLREVAYQEFSKDLEVRVPCDVANGRDLLEDEAYKLLPGFDEAVSEVEREFAEYLDQQLVGEDGDEKRLLMALKSPLDYLYDYCDSKGISRAAVDLTGEQTATAWAAAIGMHRAAVSKLPNRLDTTNGQVSIGLETYGTPKVLAAGANGKVTRYESTTTPGKYITIKTALGDKERGAKKMREEVIEHYHAQQGDPERTGANKLCKMHGVVADESGDVHMVLEYCDGGDVDENRFAMTAALESGALPEECRAILNQYIMKQALEGIAALHENNMLHNDIKPGNLMMMSDGTLRVVDFGEGVAGVDESGTIPKDRIVGTPGYDAPETFDQDVERMSLNADNYSLGKTADVLHASELAARERFRDLPFDNTTGALDRFTTALQSGPDTRATLEDALQSSYIQNLRNHDPELVQELMKAVISYGKLIDVNEVKTRQNRIQGARREMAKLETDMKALDDLDPQKNIKLQQWQQKRNQVETWQKEIKDLGSDPLATEQHARIKELSGQLQGRESPPQDDPEFVKAFKDFLVQLDSTLEDPARFVSLVNLRNAHPFYRGRGVDPAKLKNVTDCYHRDVTLENEKALETLQEAEDQIHSFISGLEDPYFEPMLGNGLRNLFSDLQQRFEKSHETKYERRKLTS